MSPLPRTNTSRLFQILAIAALAWPGACSSSDETRDRIDLVAPSDLNDVNDAEGDADTDPDRDGQDVLPEGDADSINGAVAITILAINDFHGHLEPPTGGSGAIEGTPAGGAAHLAAHIKERLAANPHSILVSAGDLIGGSPLASALFHDEPTIEVMDQIGLSLNAVGNHEFDEGYDELMRMQSGGCHPVDGCQLRTSFPGASFGFLAANVVERGRSEPILPAYRIVEFGAARVAFIGMTLEGTPRVVPVEGNEDLEFLDEVETVERVLPEIEAQGVGAIVVLIHEGGFAQGGYNGCLAASGPIMNIVAALPDTVDVVVTGHTHAAYNCLIDGKIVTSAASFGRLLTQIDLLVDPATDEVISKSALNHVVTRDISDPDVASLVAEFVALAAPLADRTFGTITETLSRTAFPSGQSPLGMVIADAQLAATAASADGGARVAFMNSGGIRAEMAYEKSGEEETDGIVTYGEAFAVQPFSNTLVVMTLTGAQIDALLEQQWTTGSGPLQVSAGFRYEYSEGAPRGSKVAPGAISIDGVALAPTDEVRVVTNNFLAGGGGGDGYTVFTEGTDLVGGPVDLDALFEYFQTNSPVAPPADDRVVPVR